jgi:hypothetical protein
LHGSNRRVKKAAMVYRERFTPALLDIL